MKFIVTIPALALCVALGCSSKPRDRKPVGPSAAANESDVSTDELNRELESAVLEILGQLTLGNLEIYADALRTDKPVTLLGARASDTFVGDGRDAVGVTRLPLLDREPEFISKNLDQRIAATGELAWTYDEVSLRFLVDGRIASLPLRLSLIFTRDVDRWVIVHDHWSFPISVPEIDRLSRAGELPVAEGLDPRRDSPSADALVKLVGQLENGDPRIREQRLSRAAGSLIVLPGIDGEYRETKIDSAPTLVELFAGGRTVGLRSHRVESTASGEAAWMIADLVVRGSDDLEIGLRASYVFEHSSSGWKVLHSHVSVPIPDGYLERILGLDGARPDVEQDVEQVASPTAR